MTTASEQKVRQMQASSVQTSSPVSRNNPIGKSDLLEENTDTEGAEYTEDDTPPPALEKPSLPPEAPPLPDEAPPTEAKDDGWAPVWDDKAQAYYFFNRFTAITQWTNPRVPEADFRPSGVGNHDRIAEKAPDVEDTLVRPHGGYDPAIHGDYDPTASYAQENQPLEDVASQPEDPSTIYTATGSFNRFTGKWQAASLTPENFNDENKSKRQMSAFFDVDAAANSHNGKSLKAERSGKKLTKQELKAFKEKRKEKKEEKRRAWLRD